MTSNFVGGPKEWSIPASRSASAFRTCSCFRPGGMDCGMTRPAPGPSHRLTAGERQIKNVGDVLRQNTVNETLALDNFMKKELELTTMYARLRSDLRLRVGGSVRQHSGRPGSTS